ncbi:MAG: hypothetical protein LBU34_13085, partial [Planctomycetaceae bacterium]|nr:hypothetical protein [Planctomycetaceae bacterium]
YKFLPPKYKHCSSEVQISLSEVQIPPSEVQIQYLFCRLLDHGEDKPYFQPDFPNKTTLVASCIPTQPTLLPYYRIPYFLIR